ncbi:MAG: 23S rRNA (uracil(1939)-C(5))-methyltransferase RlmD [Flavobacteriales bacterium]
MKKQKEAVIWTDVPITGWAANGKAIARVNASDEQPGGLVVFVTGAVPGDVADLRVTLKKKSFAEAQVQRIITPSADRVEPFCMHFGTCGGCKWQDLAYPMQLHYKRQQVVDNLERLGGLELPEVPGALASPHLTHYRNKLEFTATSARWFTKEELGTLGEITDRNALGFHIPQRFDKVFDVHTCWLQPDPSNAVRLFIREHATRHGLSFYDIRAHQGFLRNVTIRTTTTGATMVLVAFGHEDTAARESLLVAVRDAFPALTALLWCINPKKNDTIWDLDVHTFHGADHVIEELPDGPGGKPLRFRIGPKTFFQTNPEQTQAMYQLTREWAGLTGNELVYDLYCGAGSISLYVSGSAKRVIGAEIVPEAVQDAERNAALNGITNCTFEAGDLKDLLSPEFAERHGRPDVVDHRSPRAGMHEDVVMRLRELAPRRIVYVSCNPATQARDLGLLKDMYAITAVQPVDMFPHTYHVENVVRLDRMAQ